MGSVSTSRAFEHLRLDTGGNVLMLTVWRGSKYVNAAVHGTSTARLGSLKSLTGFFDLLLAMSLQLDERLLCLWQKLCT